MSSSDHIKARFYRANTDDNPTVTYVNWIKPRNLRAWWWFLTHGKLIRDWMNTQAGVLEFSITFAPPASFLIVSYWENHDHLMQAFRSKEHVDMMRTAFKNQDDFILGNETYIKPIMTNYLNEPSGYAKGDPTITAQDWHDPVVATLAIKS